MVMSLKTSAKVESPYNRLSSVPLVPGLPPFRKLPARLIIPAHTGEATLVPPMIVQQIPAYHHAAQEAGAGARRGCSCPESKPPYWGRRSRKRRERCARKQTLGPPPATCQADSWVKLRVGGFRPTAVPPAQTTSGEVQGYSVPGESPDEAT